MMKRGRVGGALLAGLWLGTAAGQVPADAARAIARSVPSTDIYLVPVQPGQDGVLPGGLRNLTDRPGYDNQPAFVPGQDAILFAAIRDGAQSDIYRLDLASGAEQRVTDTAQSEYSPTPTADGGFSVVRVEEDGSQTLWHYDQGGRPDARLVPQLGNIGYHTWLSADLLALFLVEEPARLVQVPAAGGEPVELARGIARSFPVDPASGTLYAVIDDAGGAGGASLVSRMPGDLGWRKLAPVPGDSRDLAIDGRAGVWMADGGRLLRLAVGASAWTEVADLSGLLPGPVSRLAFDHDHRYLAMVVSVPPAGAGE